MKRIKIWVLLLMGMATACQKDDGPVAAVNGSTLNYVLADNYTLQTLYILMDECHLLDTLAQKTNYTLLAPENNVLEPLGIKPPNTTSLLGLQTAFNMMRYAIMQGKVSFADLPLDTVTIVKTVQGGNVYLKRYIDGADTIITVNGFRPKSIDNPASNGLVQVVPQLLNPEFYTSATAALQSDSLTGLFAAALQRAGLTELLSGKDTYTVLAPSNKAMQAAASLGLGISTLDSILQADPAKLATLLKYHILKGRYFEGDIYRSLETSPDGIMMLNGEKVQVTGNPDGFKTITFLGAGNMGVAAGIAAPDTYAPASNLANIPCGNGVYYVINNVLIP